MRLYLIRHAESEHNVTQVNAGITDSALTNHGMLQIERLAGHFRAQGVQFTRVFASPLQRARLTAEGLCQQAPNQTQLQPTILPLLVEKDFGSLEGEGWRSASSQSTATIPPLQPDAEFKEPESVESMVARMDQFLKDIIFPILHTQQQSDEVVAIVSHGIILSVLWRTLERLCGNNHLVFSASAEFNTRRPGWSNTGYMELDVAKLSTHISHETCSQSTSPALSTGGPNAAGATDGPAVTTLRITVLLVNCRLHLRDLKRTRGGIGSSTHDPKQQKINNFFPWSSS